MTVSAQNITVRRSGRALLDDVSFAAPAGQVTGLIGPNGAGKSTLLGALSGDIIPDAGEVLLAGHNPHTLSEKTLARLRAVMMQNPTMAFSFLVRDVVEMGRLAWSRTPQAELDEDIINDALHVTGVDDLQDRDVLTLSGGERARTSLARLLAQCADIVFLDEPTAAMDIAHQEQTMEIIRRLAADGVTVIVVLHDLHAAAAYCDNVVCLKRGRLVASGSVTDVCTSDILSDVYEWPITVTTSTQGIGIIPHRAESSLTGGDLVFGRRRHASFTEQSM